jgi:hypothetical protein
MSGMPEIVVTDRVVPRILAVLPAVVIAVCVRVLTLGTPPAAVRLVAAAAVALAAWVGYRLLTVRVVVGDASIQVRGVFYDADIDYSEIADAEETSPHWAVRAVVWGLLRPTAVRLRTSSAALRPLALISAPDDEDVAKLLHAIRARSGAWRMPTQREPAESLSSR